MIEHLRPLMSKKWFPISLIAIIAVSLAVFGLIRWKSPPNYLDQTLGFVEVPGVREEGFYGPEGKTIPYRWTNGVARLFVPTHGEAPKALTVILGLNLPRPIQLVIRANGKGLFDEKVKPQEIWKHTFDLGELPKEKEAVIEILSDVYVPAEIKKGSRDKRKLGVRVVGVVLQSGRKEYLNVSLGNQFVAGVEEAGFHKLEMEGSQPFRWTMGQAHLLVPIVRTQPTKLQIVFDLPEKTKERLALLVNGQKLMDKEMVPQNGWTQVFSLADVPIEETLKIEVRSGTWVPAKTLPRSKDQRMLGVKVREIKLLDK